MEKYDPRVDAFIEKSAAFAQPVMRHIRNLVHETSPLITETIKWNCPFFEYKGPVCVMNAFKQHMAFGFWNTKSLIDSHGVIQRGEEKSSAGSFGRIISIANLPADDILKDFILQAMALNEQGNKKPAVKKGPVEKKELVVPDYFLALLDEHPKAKETFEKFSPSHKKEYVFWIIDAKTDTTRQKRLDTTIEWLTEGKPRMWKYSK